MRKVWLKKPELNYSSVFDIVQYGSSLIVDNEPNDVDVAVIFDKIPVKEQLLRAQEIKKQLQKVSELVIHIKSFDLYSLFESSNFARESILFGKSLVSGKFFAERFGFYPCVQVFYSLKQLKKKDKIRLNYMLNGKKGKYGLLREFGGKLLKPGLIEIDPAHEKSVVSAMKKITPYVTAKKILSTTVL